MLWKEAIWWIRCVRWVRNLGFIARECLLARHYTSKKGLMSSNPGIMSHTRSGLPASAILIHQAKDTFADLEQLFPRFDNHRLWKQFLWRDRLQSSLGLVRPEE